MITFCHLIPVLAGYTPPLPWLQEVIREALTRRSLPRASLDIMVSSPSDNSIKQYDVCLRKWWLYCQTHSIDHYKASVPIVISFLTEMFNDGCQYGTLNTYRAALSLILGPLLTKDDRLTRFFKGAFRMRPPLPKYTFTWDTNCVLDHLSTWYPNEDLSLDRLSRKTVTLLALTTDTESKLFQK